MIRGIQERTGGFTEFVLLPFVHASSPIYLAGLARPGPTRRENRAVHARVPAAAARRDRQRSSAPGSSSATRPAATCCTGGVNDLGGTLMEETISRMAGSQNGSYKTISQLAALVAADRPPAAAAHHAPTATRIRSGWPPRLPATESAPPSGTRGRRCRWSAPELRGRPAQSPRAAVSGCPGSLLAASSRRSAPSPTLTPDP